MKTFTAKISYVLVSIAALIFPATARGQMVDGIDPKTITLRRLVCPLSDSQTQNAIPAFAKMAPTFRQPRCANCHGGINPFADPTAHKGGTRDPQEMETGECNTCHSELPPLEHGKEPKWELPVLPDHSFVNKDATTLCKMMKRAFHKGLDFEMHILNDNGKTNFQGIAFLGTRGIPGIERDPIRGITLGQFFSQAEAWVEAMDVDEFEGDDRCGCVAMHFAIEVYYEATINLGILHNVLKEGPITIPITFKDDRTFVGQGTFPMSTAGTDAACVSQGQGSMMVQVTGKAVEELNDHRMHIELTNVSPLSGSVVVSCPPLGYAGQLGGTNKRTLKFDLLGFIGEAQAQPLPLPAPGLQNRVCVKLIDLSLPSGTDAPCTTTPVDTSGS